MQEASFLSGLPGPGILLINLFSTVLASNDWGLGTWDPCIVQACRKCRNVRCSCSSRLQLNILPLLGFSALLFTVLALFIIPKARTGGGSLFK